ncbi:MAG: hypothetical protein LW728_22240 [Microcystis sp. 49638_E5]|nr:hypothetical protein [Microcystis sp. 49638_E5]MCE2671859.1 hypothetical protein [Microcystis sp. 49638_E5]
MSHEIAGTYGLAAMDALHVAAALQIQADELITTEKPTKPIFCALLSLNLVGV